MQAAPSKRRDESWLQQQLAEYRHVTLEELTRRVPRHLPKTTLRDLILDYPLRPGKALRPALCMATCEAFGGRRKHALFSAVAIELFHNSFLVHDDIEDGSLLRRGLPTLHVKYGVPLAINAGDAMSVLTLRALLDNFGLLGVDKTQRIFEEIEWMVLQSVEGQSIELGWVEQATWNLVERDYYRMSLKKTGWYTCITPCRIGAIIGGARLGDVNAFNAFGHYLGIAFQIQDDILNLRGEETVYGKETAGDLWEGKRTVAIIHLIHSLGHDERGRLIAILNKARDQKQPDEIEWILRQMALHGSIDHAKQVAWSFARKAHDVLRTRLAGLPASNARHFLQAIVDYVVYRDL
jgi:geranylgeranyl diphosphate synthase, type II